MSAIGANLAGGGRCQVVIRTDPAVRQFSFDSAPRDAHHQCTGRPAAYARSGAAGSRRTRMRTKLALLAAAVAAAAAPAAAADATAGMTKGAPPVKSITALAFGPEGVLFLGDPASAAVFAVATGDTAPAGKEDVRVEKAAEKIGSMLGVPAGQVKIEDVKVNPASGNVYLAVTRGRGPDASAVVMRLTRDGKMGEFQLKDVPFASAPLPSANDKNRTEAITSMAYVDGKVLVAGLSNEEFASTLRTFPYPFTGDAKTTGVKIFHGAHGRYETQAPIRTFATYKIADKEHVLAAYTCTPLVKIPVDDLKPGAKVTGTTIAELGNMNRPYDMIVYTKDGKDYVLMSNSARGVMKIPAEHFATAEGITVRPKTAKAGIEYETVAELKGVQQLDKLDDARALL